MLLLLEVDGVVILSGLNLPVERIEKKLKLCKVQPLYLYKTIFKGCVMTTINSAENFSQKVHNLKTKNDGKEFGEEVAKEAHDKKNPALNEVEEELAVDEAKNLLLKEEFKMEIEQQKLKDSLKFSSYNIIKNNQLESNIQKKEITDTIDTRKIKNDVLPI